MNARLEDDEGATSGHCVQTTLGNDELRVQFVNKAVGYVRVNKRPVDLFPIIIIDAR